MTQKDGMVFVNKIMPKTLNMKKLSLILCIFIVSVSCDKDRINENFQDDTSIQNINGTWKVVSYEDFEKASVTVKNDVDSWNGMDVILTFANDSLYGQCTTNSISGNYTLAGRYINIDSYGGTKIGQPVWGNMFTDIVYLIRSFEINEHQLRFYYDNSEKSVTLRRN
jgi:hypothetical protein